MARGRTGQAAWLKGIRVALGFVGRACCAGLRWCAMPVMALAAYSGGTWALWQYAAMRAVKPADPRTEVAACPWLSAADVAAINAGAELGAGATLYDRGLCLRAAERYAANPWVERVISVRRAFPDRVVAELAIRRPYACVRSGRLYYAVDRSGYRLPMVPGRRGDFPCVAVEGVQASLPEIGAAWDGRQVTDAVRLAEILSETFQSRNSDLRLASVELCAADGVLDGLPEFQACTESGMVIDWGSLNEDGTELLPSIAEKRQELIRVLDRVVDPAAIDTIMVRHRCPASIYMRETAGRNSGGSLGVAIAEGQVMH